MVLAAWTSFQNQTLKSENKSKYKYLHSTPSISLSSSFEMIVGNSEDEAVKDDGDDDGEYYCHPNFHIWPDSVTPGLVLIRVIIHPWICKYRNLFNKHCDDAKEY